MMSTKFRARWSSGENVMVDFMLIKSAFGVIITFWSNFALDIQKKCRQNLCIYQADHLVKTFPVIPRHVGRVNTSQKAWLCWLVLSMPKYNRFGRYIPAKWSSVIIFLILVTVMTCHALPECVKRIKQCHRDKNTLIQAINIYKTDAKKTRLDWEGGPAIAKQFNVPYQTLINHIKMSKYNL